MSKHDEIANKLAKKFKTEYKSDKGIDLVLKDRVIEVETKNPVLESRKCPNYYVRRTKRTKIERNISKI